jgi:hypothetical protein
MMKKMTFYVILLSLMSACKHEPSIDCSAPTDDLNIARALITGRWELERTFLASRGIGIVRKTKNQLPRSVITFYSDSTCKYFVADTLLYAGDFRFVEFTGDQYLRFENAKGYYYSTIFRICDDSLYLLYNASSDADANEIWAKK